MRKSDASGCCLIAIATVRQNVNTALYLHNRGKAKNADSYLFNQGCDYTFLHCLFGLLLIGAGGRGQRSLLTPPSDPPRPSFITRDPNTCTTRSEGKGGDLKLRLFPRIS